VGNYSPLLFKKGTKKKGTGPFFFVFFDRKGRKSGTLILKIEI